MTKYLAGTFAALALLSTGCRKQGSAEYRSGAGAYDTGKRGQVGAQQSVSGTVKGTPLDNLTLLDPNGGEIKLDTSKSTLIMQNGQPLKLHDIKDGAEVRASYHMKGNTKEADKIEVISNPISNEKVKDTGEVEPK